MPGDYRNSLGYLGLQLRAGQLAQDQARQFQLEQQGREAAQSDVQNTLAFMKQHEASKQASEDRKLQIAALLQKAQEDRALREKLGEATVAVKDKTATEAGRHNKVTEGQGATKIENDRQYRTASVEEDRRGHDLQFLGRVAGEFAHPDVYGRRALQLDNGFIQAMGDSLQHPATTDTSTPTQEVPTQRQAAPPSPASTEPTPPASSQAQPPAQHTISSLLQLAPPRDPNVQPLPPKDLAKTALEANDLRAGADRLEKLYETATGLDKRYFGLGGGAVGMNWLKDMGAKVQTVTGKSGTDLQKGSAERAAFESGIGLEMAQTVRDFSGAQSAEPEAKRLGQTTGVTPQDFDLIGKDKMSPFNLDQPVFLKVLRAAIDWKKSKAANKQQIVDDQGVRSGPAPTAPPPAAAPVSDILKRAAADPVVSKKLRDLEERMPKDKSAEWKRQALEAAAERWLSQAVSPQ